jgi:hypothetical protein
MRMVAHCCHVHGIVAIRLAGTCQWGKNCTHLCRGCVEGLAAVSRGKGCGGERIQGRCGQVRVGEMAVDRVEELPAPVMLLPQFSYGEHVQQQGREGKGQPRGIWQGKGQPRGSMGFGQRRHCQIKSSMGDEVEGGRVGSGGTARSTPFRT